MPLLFQQMASQPFRHRRDGKMFKAWWLTKRQTRWLKKAPPENGGYFYRTDLRRPANEWEGVFEHEGVMMLVNVVIAYRGTSYITVTREGRKS